MKKKFQFFLIFLLTYAFICCPVFVGSSFAGSTTNSTSSTAPWTGKIGSMKSTLAFIKDNISTWMGDFNIPPTSSADIQANMAARKKIVQAIRDNLKGTK
jgi:hypothetical protein